MPFRRYSGAAGGGETGPSGQGDVRRDMAWHCRRLAAGGLPGSPGGDKRGRDTKVSLPLLTPQPFLRTRLPPVARLNARGPQGRLLLQEYTLDGSGAFRSDGACALHRLAAHCHARQPTQSKFRAIKRPQICPTPGIVLPYPRFAAHLRCVSAKEGLGSQEGTGNHWCPVPFCLRRQTAALPAAESGHSAAPSEGVKSPPAVYRCIGGRSTVCRWYKERADARWGTICKMFTFEPLTQDEKTAYII